MPVAKITVSIDEKTLQRLDALVHGGLFPNRSKAVQAALENQLGGMDRSRLATECAKLDATGERRAAGEGLGFEAERWPEY